MNESLVTDLITRMAFDFDLSHEERSMLQGLTFENYSDRHMDLIRSVRDRLHLDFLRAKGLVDQWKEAHPEWESGLTASVVNAGESHLQQVVMASLALKGQEEDVPPEPTPSEADEEVVQEKKPSWVSRSGQRMDAELTRDIFIGSTLGYKTGVHFPAGSSGSVKRIPKDKRTGETEFWLTSGQPYYDTRAGKLHAMTTEKDQKITVNWSDVHIDPFLDTGAPEEEARGEIKMVPHPPAVVREIQDKLLKDMVNNRMLIRKKLAETWLAYHKIKPEDWYEGKVKFEDTPRRQYEQTLGKAVEDAARKARGGVNKEQARAEYEQVRTAAWQKFRQAKDEAHQAIVAPLQAEDKRLHNRALREFDQALKALDNPDVYNRKDELFQNAQEEMRILFDVAESRRSWTDPAAGMGKML